MKTGIFFLASELHDQNLLLVLKSQLIEKLKKLDHIFEVQPHEFSSCDLLLIAIMTGGSEQKFQEIWPDLNSSSRPFALLAFENNNSLPAAIEIKSWLDQNSATNNYEILHGDNESIIEKIVELHTFNAKRIKISREVLGIIGDSSDWLVASTPDLKKIRQYFGIRTNFIPFKEFENIFQNLNEEQSKEFRKAFSQNLSVSDKEFAASEKIFLALKKTINNYCLTALTIRCFDLIEKYKATGCLALSLLNDQNIVSGCEGDVPAAVSMIVARHFSNKPVFMANPARVKNDEALFAHCTVPCSLLNDFELKSHFESNLGLAIAGHFNEGKATLFKISSDAEHFAVFSGIIKPCNHQDNLCRTQVRFIAEGLEKYLLEKPLGNHQILVSGDYSKQLEKYCVISGLNKVN